MLFCLIFSSKAFSCGFFWCHYIHVALHFQNFLDLFSLIKSLQYFIFYFSTILFILPRWQLPTCINSIISAHVSSHVTYALKVVFRMEGIYPALRWVSGCWRWNLEKVRNLCSHQNGVHIFCPLLPSWSIFSLFAVCLGMALHIGNMLNKEGNVSVGGREEQGCGLRKQVRYNVQWQSLPLEWYNIEVEGSKGSSPTETKGRECWAEWHRHGPSLADGWEGSHWAVQSSPSSMRSL